MDRRSFLKSSAALSAASAASIVTPFSFAAEQKWRTFEVTTKVDLNTVGPASIWLPVPTVNTDYQKVLGSSF